MRLFIYITCALLQTSVLFALYESKLGRIDASATLKVAYDSRVFGMPSDEFKSVKDSNGSTGINTSRLESEHDFILTFSPAVHFTNKLGLFKINGSAGVQINQYILNGDMSNIVPTTSLSIDFDDTLALKKRISNNAKIRFESTFDVGQHVGASVLDQDLVSYTYISAGLNVRYNHSAKFGVGGGTSYSYRFYQSANTDDRPNLDFSTLPLSLRAFYIYSEKLDFFTNYTFARSKAHGTSQSNLTDAINHSISIGADGVYSSKFSGSVSLGYSLVDYELANQPNQDNLITSVSLNWKHNSKTTSNYSLSRAFSPTAQGFSTFSTSLRAGISHRFTDTLSGTSYLSAGITDYTYPQTFSTNNDPNKGKVDSSSMKTYGFGFGVSKKHSKIFSSSAGYDYTLMDKNSKSGSYGRHLVHAQITGRF
ncbi:MAG: outer membrane beta-barrel protein [Opitutales bacterium]